jgi:ubiquinone biosynthesis protein COQ4
MDTLAAPTLRIPPLPARLRTIFRSLATLARDPGRLDVVLVLALTVNLPALGRGLARVQLDEAGRRMLEERPRIDRASVDFAALTALPDGTLGREYARFLADNKISPEPFETMPDIGDERAAYVILRLRQTHDLWHVLTGYTPDVRGEVLLQGFTFGQTTAPSALLIATFGYLRWGLWQKWTLRELVHAYRRGKATKFLATFRWEDHWATPVSELREQLACPARQA